MRELSRIGSVDWESSEAVQSLEEFSKVYERRPIRDNDGGMKFPHMFALWFMVKKLSPELVVESGIWKGQSTWLIEQACPEAKIFSIDIDLKNRQYISQKATYSDIDFKEQDWTSIPENSLLFVDDHQNAYDRLQQAYWFGFKHVIFEDNYPGGHGDCYSLKKAFEGAGFEPLERMGKKSVLANILVTLKAALMKKFFQALSLMPQYSSVRVNRNEFDAKLLKKRLKTYYEFPPVIKPKHTRWGTQWNDDVYPTPEPLLVDQSDPLYQKYLSEAVDYTWICYAKMG